jgi:hypothetical protein
LRVNIAWVGGANRCTPPSDSPELQKGEGETTAFLVRSLSRPLVSQHMRKTVCPLCGWLLVSFRTYDYIFVYCCRLCPTPSFFSSPSSFLRVPDGWPSKV